MAHVSDERAGVCSSDMASRGGVGGTRACVCVCVRVGEKGDVGCVENILSGRDNVFLFPINISYILKISSPLIYTCKLLLSFVAYNNINCTLFKRERKRME